MPHEMRSKTPLHEGGLKKLGEGCPPQEETIGSAAFAYGIESVWPMRMLSLVSPFAPWIAETLVP